MTSPPAKRKRLGLAPVRAGLAALLITGACLGGLAGGVLLSRLLQSPALPPTAVALAEHTPDGTDTPARPSTQTPQPASPTPAPTQTPNPPARLALADAALFDGDWSLAEQHYLAVLDQAGDAELEAAAQLGLARARLGRGDAAAAASGLAGWLAGSPEHGQAAAHFILGESHSAQGQWAAAAQAYRAYLAHQPGLIDSYVHEAIASAALQLGDQVAAIQALEAAIAAPRQAPPHDLRERLGSLFAAAGEVDAALAQYQAVYDTTNEAWRQARMDVLAGQLLYANGRTEQAYAEFRHAVDNYPEYPITFEALVVLVNDGQPVSELQRGLTNYHARNYAPALAAFQRYLDSGTASLSGASTALFHIGLTHQASGQTPQAIAAWRKLLADYASGPHYARAWFQIAFAQPYPDDVQTFIDFVAAAPGAADAPDALFRAARLCERNRDFARAAELWTRIAQEYPSASQAADGAMQAGIVFYRQGQYASAAQRFELAASLAGSPNEQARAWLWLGKARQQLGNNATARAAWQQAAALGGHTYYPLRAAQLLRGEPPFNPPAGYGFSFDLRAEQAEMDAWLRERFPAAQSVQRPSELAPAVWQQPRFARGAELWRLGRVREAHAEFNSLRLDLSGDPLALWQLAVYWHDIGAYDLGIRSARTVVDRAGLADSLSAPAYNLRLRFPAPFAERVVEASQRYELHPFLMYSKMRIESFFWKYAFSSASARGLNQIIPSTADDIARQLGMSDFVQDDLFRPAVVIPMGAYYLNYVARITGYDPPVLLAGYYAGPGNAQAWQGLADDDYDLFVEVIRLPDAKGYVMTTFEYFEVYRGLYGRE
jgi:soluble lytic murein transglycosylase